MVSSNLQIILFYVTEVIIGLGQSLAALGRTLGPAIAGSVFSWSLGNHLSYPFDFRFVYILLTFFCLFLILVSLRLPKSFEMSFADHEKEIELDDHTLEQLELEET